MKRILESPCRDMYLSRLHQFYSQAAELSMELFDESFFDHADVSERNIQLSLSDQYEAYENQNDIL